MVLAQNRLFMQKGVHVLGVSPQRNVMGRMEEKKKEEEERAFREDIDNFLSKQEFNLFDFHERVMVSASSQSGK